MLQEYELFLMKCAPAKGAAPLAAGSHYLFYS